MFFKILSTNFSTVNHKEFHELAFFGQPIKGFSFLKGAFNDYVDKKRWQVVQKIPIFVHVQG